MPKKSRLENYMAKHLGTLPDPALKDVCSSDEQLADFWSLSLDLQAISQCWQARLNGKPDPLEHLVEDKVICEEKHSHLWLQVSYYQRIWELCQLGFRFFKKELKTLDESCPFTSASELFQNLVEHKIENSLMQIVNDSQPMPYTTFNRLANNFSEITSFSDLPAHKEKRLFNENRSALAQLQVNRNEWSKLLMISCSQNLKRSEALASAFRGYLGVVEDIAKFEKKLTEKSVKH